MDQSQSTRQHDDYCLPCFESHIYWCSAMYARYLHTPGWSLLTMLLGRDPEYSALNVRFTVKVANATRILQKVPNILKPYAIMIPLVYGLIRYLLNLKDCSSHSHNPPTIAQSCAQTSRTRHRGTQAENRGIWYRLSGQTRQFVHQVTSIMSD